MVHNLKTAGPTEMSQPRSAVSTGIPFWDMMLSMSRTSQQMLAGYGPRTESQAGSKDTMPQPSGNVEVIPLGEETLNVGTRLVTGETTRVRRIVVETPVEKAVSLRESRVIVERRKPTIASATTADGILTDSTVELSDSFEVVEVWKSARVTEEVVLRHEVTERHQTVRDTVRHDEIVVEQAQRALPDSRPVAGIAHVRTVAPAPHVELAANLSEAAEQFEMSAAQKEQALATLHATLEPATGTLDADHNRTASSPRPPIAELPKPPVAAKRSDATTPPAEKGRAAPASKI